MTLTKSEREIVLLALMIADLAFLMDERGLRLDAMLAAIVQRMPELRDTITAATLRHQLELTRARHQARGSSSH